MSEADEINISIKQRLVGAIVLVSLGVIFLPMVLDGDGPFDVVKREKFIPEEPQLRQVFDVKQAELSRLTARSEAKPVAKPVAKSEAKSVVKKPPVSKQVNQKTAQSTDTSEQESELFSVSIVDRISEEALRISALLTETKSEESKESTSNKSIVADLNKDIAPASSTNRQAPKGNSKNNFKNNSKNKDVATLSKPAKMIQKLKNNNEKTVKAWAVQLGSFKTKPNAFKLRDRLRTKGFPSYVESVKTKKGASYRVRVGPENLLIGAENLKLKLSQVAKLDGIIVRH